jgi:AraC-like DNA-binding protein
MESSVELLDREAAWRWRDDTLGDVEFLHARYLTHSYAPHTHDGYAFGVIEWGAEAFWYRGATRVATPGQIVALNPDELHTGGAARGVAGWTYRMIYPAAELLERAVAAVGRRALLPTFPESVIRDDEMSHAFVAFHRTVAAHDGALAEATSLLDVLTLLVRRHASDARQEDVAPRDSVVARTVREYLEANYQRNVTLGELSAVARVSPFHLARLFRRACGIPPHRYLEQLRARHAKRLIWAGQSLSAVAADVGFADQSQLTRHFKRHYGVTPGAYRRAVAGNTSTRVEVARLVNSALE